MWDTVITRLSNVRTVESWNLYPVVENGTVATVVAPLLNVAVPVTS